MECEIGSIDKKGDSLWQVIAAAEAQSKKVCSQGLWQQEVVQQRGQSQSALGPCDCLFLQLFVSSTLAKTLRRELNRKVKDLDVFFLFISWL